MSILGIDPGFSSLGWAIVEQDKLGLLAKFCGVIHTEKTSKKVQLRSSEDNIRRAQQIYEELNLLFQAYEINLICTETMSWPRNAGVVAKMGIVWGVIASVAQLHRVPMIQASPMEIKRAVTGNGKAGKDHMIATIRYKFPELNMPPQATLQEHAADAVGAVIACQTSQLFKVIHVNDII
jgi:crossover junction endodeoxyribonuclease RuvC